MRISEWSSDVCSSDLGLPLLVSLVTGLVVYKRFWKGFFRPTLRIRHGARIFWGDFHRLSGIWSIWFIAVISITGTWFLIQALLSDNQISIRSEEHTSELQSLMRISYAVFCLKKKKKHKKTNNTSNKQKQ